MFLFRVISAQVESTFLTNSGPKLIEVRVKSEPVRFTSESLASANSHPLRLNVDDRDNCQVAIALFPKVILSLQCVFEVLFSFVINININICSIELKWDGKITKIWYDNEMRW